MAKTPYNKSIIEAIGGNVSKISLIWNIFAWLEFFDGQIKCSAPMVNKKEYWLLFDTEKSSFSANINSKKDLLAADCVLTWWANMGVDQNLNEDGENIFDLDLTKEKNRDKFTA